MENRSALLVCAVTTHADGVGERVAALAMLNSQIGTHLKTFGSDKAYDTADFVAACCQRKVIRQVARNLVRHAVVPSTCAPRAMPATGPCIEEHFDSGKTVGRISKTVLRGLRRVDQPFKLTMDASNIVRIARILNELRQEATQ